MTGCCIRCEKGWDFCACPEGPLVELPEETVRWLVHVFPEKAEQIRATQQQIADVRASKPPKHYIMDAEPGVYSTKGE